MKIAIVYHSETGNTRDMAELIREGCEQVDGVEAQCMSVDAVDDAYVIDSQAVPTLRGSRCHLSPCASPG